MGGSNGQTLPDSRKTYEGLFAQNDTGLVQSRAKLLSSIFLTSATNGEGIMLNKGSIMAVTAPAAGDTGFGAAVILRQEHGSKHLAILAKEPATDLTGMLSGTATDSLRGIWKEKLETARSQHLASLSQAIRIADQNARHAIVNLRERSKAAVINNPEYTAIRSIRADRGTVGKFLARITGAEERESTRLHVFETEVKTIKEIWAKALEEEENILTEFENLLEARRQDQTKPEWLAAEMAGLEAAFRIAAQETPAPVEEPPAAPSGPVLEHTLHPGGSPSKEEQELAREWQQALEIHREDMAALRRHEMDLHRRHMLAQMAQDHELRRDRGRHPGH